MEDLERGDPIVSFDLRTHRPVITRVTASRSGVRVVGRIRFDGGELMLTYDHPIYDPHEAVYETANAWFSGERRKIALVNVDLLEEWTIVDASPIVGIDEVFDISIDHPAHNFIAEQVLVHNKSEGLEPCPDDPLMFEGGGCYCGRDEPRGFWDCDSKTCYCPDPIWANNHVADMTSDAATDAGDLADSSDLSDADTTADMSGIDDFSSGDTGAD